MKKHLTSFTNLLAITASLAAFVIPAVSQAQTAVACPAGYICTTIPTTPGCPTGYICTPATGGSGSSAGGGGGGGSPVQATTDATVTVTGAPTLKLTYDANNGEAALTSNFTVSINGGSRGINIYQKNGSIQILNSQQNGPSMVTSGLVPVSYASSTYDNAGNPLWLIPAGQSVNFTLSGTANPKQMFAGTYAASLYGLGALVGFDSSTGYVNIQPAKAVQTNSVTIVGEVSPYITGFSSTQPFTSGQTIAITGSRLDTSGGIFIDGASVGTSFKGDQNNVGLTLPSLADGSHYVYITSIKTGTSNNVSFQVQNNGGSTGCYSFSTNLHVGMVNTTDIPALQTWLIAHGYHIAAIESGKQDKGYYGNQTGDAVSRLQAAVGVSDPKYAGYGYFGPLTRGWLNSHCTTTPPVTVSCPAGYICSTPGSTATCPAGYVCTPVAITNCPSGYTCYTSTPVSTNPPTSCNSGGSYQFYSNLTLGSTGPDVVALQTWLIANGYHIAGIESGAVAKGYYDAQTQTAVSQFQTAKGLPVTGSADALTRGVLNSGCGSGTPTVTCPAGYVCTTVGTTTPTQPPVNNNPITFQAVFNKTFNLTNVPTTATLGLAADNNYLVWVNDTYVGTGRNESSGQGNNNFDNLTTFNVAPYLHTGSNTLRITGQNYYSTYTSWPNNAFGLLYKLTDANGNILTASDGSESIGLATISGGSSVVLSQPHQWYVTTPGASWIWDSADPLYATYLSYIGQGQTPTQTQASIRVISPNGGESFNLGSGINITWSASNLTKNGQNNIELINSSGADIYTIYATNLLTGTSYSWTPNTNWTPGNYKIRIKSTDPATGVTVSDDSDNFFTLVPATQSNQPPLISSITGPDQVALQSGGTYTVSATDPQNGTLSYAANWGDGACSLFTTCQPGAMPPDAAYVQRYSFSHNYISIGTYTATFVVRNSAGQTSQITKTVAVVGASSAPQFNLIGTPTITKNVISTDQNGNSTTTYTSTFNVQVTAGSSNIMMGLPNSSVAAFSFTNPLEWSIFKNGVPDNMLNYPVANLSYSAPSNAVVSADGLSFTVAANQTVTIPVTMTFSVLNPGANTYKVQLIGVQVFTGPGYTGVTNYPQSGWSTSVAMAPSQSAMTAAIYDAIRTYYAGH